MATAADLEVFRHALKGVVEEMGLTLQRTAYSTNIKIRRDHTTTLFDSELRHIAQHDVAPQHVGSMVSVVPRNIDGRQDELEPGDGILVNDPYKGSVHLPDIILISPLFYDGGIVGYAANSAHHVDVGGSAPGGIPISRDLYGEGIIIPSVKAVEDWEFDEAVLALLARNMRGSRMRIGDFNAQLGANKIGQERFSQLLDDRGIENVRESIEELLNYTERRVRANLRELPDGTYEAEDYMDGDGISDDPVLLKLTLKIDGDEMKIDFSGTASQNTGPLNCTPAMVFAGVMYVIMAYIGEDLPKNDGFYRPFEMITPEGTMVNPVPNAPVAGGWEICMRSCELATKALSEALPKEAIAATKGIICNVAYGGTDPRDGEEYVYYETFGGGYGARYDKDGLDGVQSHLQDTANSPIEELETEVPLYVRQYEFIPDSEGAGRSRGGLGIRRDMEFYDHEASFSLLTDRTKSDPWGLFGGDSGRRSHFFLNPDSEDSTVLGSKSTTTLAPDDVASVQTPGGGGYGDPLERDPEKVRRDVRDGIVSPERARDTYGVVIDLEARSVDEEETRDRRVELRAARDEEGDG